MFRKTVASDLQLLKSQICHSRSSEARRPVLLSPQTPIAYRLKRLSQSRVSGAPPETTRGPRVLPIRVHSRSPRRVLRLLSPVTYPLKLPCPIA
jgi:hypothetical protein